MDCDEMDGDEMDGDELHCAWQVLADGKITSNLLAERNIPDALFFHYCCRLHTGVKWLLQQPGL